MDLFEKQKSLQKSIVVDVGEKVKRDKFISMQLNKFAKQMLDLKREKFLEVAKKLIAQDEQEYKKILNVDAKNIEDNLAKPFAYLFIEQVEKLSKFDRVIVGEDKEIESRSTLIYEKIFELKFDKDELLHKIQKSAKQVFKGVKKGNIEEAYRYFEKEYLKHYELFNIGFLGDKNVDKKQVAIFFLSPLPSTLISLTVMVGSLDLLGVYEASDKSNSWQNVVTNIVRELVYQAKRYGFDRELDEIKEEYKQEIGGVIVESLINYGILYEDEEETESKNMTSLRFAEEFLKSAEKFLKKEYTKSIYKPMVVEPKDWSGLEGGGFLQYEGMDERYRVWLMKAQTPPDKEAIKSLSFPKPILEAINYLQKVGYRINKDILHNYEMLLKEFKIPKSYKMLKKRLIEIKILLQLRDEFKGSGKVDIEEALNSKELHYFRNLFQNRALKSKEKAIKNLKPYINDFVQNQDNKKFWKRLEIEYEMVKFGSSLHIILDIAREFSKYERIFFVWQMDFRGRVYPVQTLLHPQGDDFVKALLEFDRKKEIKDPKWLKITGASLFGLDKKSFEERIAWFEANEDKILAVADGSDWWMDADEPYEFLAFCFDYREYKRSGKSSFIVAIDGSNNGIQHISAMLRDSDSATNVNVLPTDAPKDIYIEVLEAFKKRLENEMESIDKSGYEVEHIEEYEIYYEEIREEETEELYHKNFFDRLIEVVEEVDLKKDFREQIYSALKSLKAKEKKFIKELDEKIKEEEWDKEDIVYEIESKKKRVSKRVRQGKYSENKEYIVALSQKVKKKYNYSSLHRYIIDKLDRSFIKKPVMIDAYGAGVKSKAEKIEESLKEFLFLDENIIKGYSRYLAEIVEDTIDSVIKCAGVYEKFMQNLIKDIFVTNPKYISWKTPLGLEVKQVEFKSSKKDIKFFYQGKEQTVSYREFSKEIDKNAHKKGIVPNFVHSMDATHLYRALLRLKELGIDHIRPIHDSFGVYADDVDTLQRVLREEFYKLYTPLVLNNFIDDIKERYKGIKFQAIEKYLKKLQKNNTIEKVNRYNPIIDTDFPLEAILKSQYMFS